MQSSIDKRAQQEEYIRSHATRIVSFAQYSQAHHGRGIILIGWPGQDSRQRIDELVFLEEKSVEQAMRRLQVQGEETLADRIIQAVQEYDLKWEVVIVFLDNVCLIADLHVARFIPEYPAERTFQHLVHSTMNH